MRGILLKKLLRIRVNSEVKTFRKFFMVLVPISPPQTPFLSVGDIYFLFLGDVKDFSSLVFHKS